MVSTIIEKLDEADAIIRKDLKEHKGIPVGELVAYKKARELIQQAITALVRYQS